METIFGTPMEGAAPDAAPLRPGPALPGLALRQGEAAGSQWIGLGLSNSGPLKWRYNAGENAMREIFSGTNNIIPATLFRGRTRMAASGSFLATEKRNQEPHMTSIWFFRAKQYFPQDHLAT